MITDKKLILKTEHITTMSKNRLENQDSSLINTDKNIFIIADGMSGWNGKNASSAAVEAISGLLEAKLNNSMSNDEIGFLLMESLEKARKDVSLLRVKSGTTVDIGILHNGIFHFAHIGHGRIYAQHNSGRLEQVTEDMVQPQDTYTGREAITEIEKKILSLTNNYMPSNWIGRRNLQDEGTIQFGRIPLKNIKRILMATDGLFDLVLNDEIEEALLLDKLEDVAPKLQSYSRRPYSISETFITHLEFFLENHIVEKSILPILDPILNRYSNNKNIVEMRDHYKSKNIAHSKLKKFMLDYFKKYPDVKDLFLKYINDVLSFSDDTTFIVIEPHNCSTRTEIKDEIAINNITTDLMCANESFPQKMHKERNGNGKQLQLERIQKLEYTIKLAEEKSSRNIQKLDEGFNDQIEEEQRQLAELQKAYDDLEIKQSSIIANYKKSPEFMGDVSSIIKSAIDFTDDQSKYLDCKGPQQRELVVSISDLISTIVDKSISKTRSELDEYYETALEQQAEELNACITVVGESSNKLEQANNKLKQANNLLEHTNAELGGSNNKFRRDNNRLEQTNNQLEEVNGALGQTNDKLEQTNRKLDSRLTEKSKLYEENKATYYASMKELDDLKKQFEDYKFQEQDRTNKVKEEYRESSELESLINKQVAEETSKLTSRISELEEQNQKLSGLIFNSEESLLKTKDELLKTKAKSALLKFREQRSKEDYEKVKGEKEKLEEAGKQKTSELQDAMNVINEVKANHENIIAEKDKQEEADRLNITELKEEVQNVINKTKTDYENIKAEKGNLEESNRQKTSKLQDSENLIIKAKVDYEKMKVERDNLEGAYIQKASELKEAENSINKAKIDYENIKFDKKDLEEANRQKTSELQSMKDVIVKFKTDYDRVKDLDQIIDNLLGNNRKDVNQTDKTMQELKI